MGRSGGVTHCRNCGQEIVPESRAVRAPWVHAVDMDPRCDLWASPESRDKLFTNGSVRDRVTT